MNVLSSILCWRGPRRIIAMPNPFCCICISSCIYSVNKICLNQTNAAINWQFEGHHLLLFFSFTGKNKFSALWGSQLESMSSKFARLHERHQLAGMFQMIVYFNEYDHHIDLLWRMFLYLPCLVKRCISRYSICVILFYIYNSCQFIWKSY